MSERHGLTLRKKRNKRPTISSPTSPPIRPGQQLPTQPSSFLPPQQEKREPTDISDLVKRRYSTRYNQIPNFGDAPDVPALPNQLKRSSRGPSPRRPATAQSIQPLTVDQSALADPDLQHERYITELLSNASLQDIQDYQNNLRRVKHRTSMELQQSVYQNRTQFIRISKEAERLKSEMTVLRTLMSELTKALAITDVTYDSGADGNAATRRVVNRSSVANLESMWNTQLQQLWKQIEKSQKFLPAVPGRHVVMEIGGWIELDSATWKARRPVHIVLLNDHFLIASKKRKRMDPNIPNQGPAPTKLVAEECWPLGDIDLIDMEQSMAGGPVSKAEEKNMATAVTVRSGSRSLTYRHEKRDQRAKQELLIAFRKAAEDHRKANLPNQEKTPQADTLNYLASRDAVSASKDPELLSNLTNSIIKDKTVTSARASGIIARESKHDILIDVDGTQQNYRWIESQIDDLDIDIALQRSDEAVAQVERLRDIARTMTKLPGKSNSYIAANGDTSNINGSTNSNLSIAQNLILLKIDERASQLATTLCRDLQEVTSFIESTRRITTHLIRLGYEDQARKVYLSTRAQILNNRSRSCIFDGDLHKYIFSISYVYFTIVKNTTMIYQAAFCSSSTASTSTSSSTTTSASSSLNMSACIQWGAEQLEIFNELLVRQLSSVEKGGKVWKECVDVVWSHEREMLGNVGLDFREVIGRGLSLSPTGGSEKVVNGGGGSDNKIVITTPSSSGSRPMSRSKSKGT